MDAGSLELTPGEMAAARLFVIAADRFAMREWTRRHPNSPWTFSQELEHDLRTFSQTAKFYAKTANGAGETKTANWWEELGEWAEQEARKQFEMFYLC